MNKYYLLESARENYEDNTFSKPNGFLVGNDFTEHNILKKFLVYCKKKTPLSIGTLK